MLGEALAPNAGTRARLVEAARDLFHRQGYQATTLAAVAAKSNANAGSLYYFFRTKEQLLMAVLDRYLELLDPVVMEPARATSDNPIERIFVVLDGYRRMLLDTEFLVGCPIGNLALEVTDPAAEVQEKILANFEQWCHAIERSLEEARGDLPESLDVGRLSRFVLTVMEGAVLQARGYRSIQPFDDSVAELRSHFDRLLAVVEPRND